MTVSTSQAAGLTLRAEGLGCRRGGRLLFDSLNLSVQPGELLQIAGPNGCGKTSLLRILCGLRTPDSGQVRWGGGDIRDIADEFRAELLFIGIQPGIKLDLSPRENLDYAAAIGADTRLSAEQALKDVGLAAWADTPCRQLSTGQIRRAALARLNMLNCPLWVLDEPLTGLDQQARVEIESAMFRHASDGGIVVFTTHNPLQGRHDGLRLLALGA